MTTDGAASTRPRLDSRYFYCVFAGATSPVSDDEINCYVQQWFKPRPAEFSDVSVLKLIIRHDKCLTIHGNYVDT